MLYGRSSWKSTEMLDKIIIITNIPAPYRVLQFNELAKDLKEKLCVIYFQETEPNRNWDMPRLEHRALFLKRNIFSGINFYPNIIKCLNHEKPDIIIAAGFTLTSLITFLYAQLTKKKFVVFTDTWLYPIKNMKFYHRIVRRVIIQRADASICVGIKGKKFLLKYGAKENAIFISPLAINNYLFQSFHQPFETKEFDIIFSGQLINRKMPFFVIDVLKELKDFKKDISILIIGSGPLEGEIINQLDYYKIKYFFPGFIQQLELPKYYANSKVLLFPSKDDPWGLVANEACAVGTPVITCLNTGVANDLIIHGFNGFVLPLIVDVWVDHVYKLLSDIELYNTFSNNSLFLIKKYSIENAVDGIKNAISYLLNNESN